MKIHLNIGSNRGNRFLNIEKAIARLLAVFEVDGNHSRQSDPIETEPWGFDSDNRFINVGLQIEVERELLPEQVLDITQTVERELNHGEPHRAPTGEYLDRYIDIDIIDIDSIIFSSERLQLPHNLMHRRNFVLLPMMQLNDSWVHPVMHKTACELLKEMQ